MASVTHTDPGDTFQTLGRCGTLLGGGKTTTRQHKLELLFTELSKELETNMYIIPVYIGNMETKYSSFPPYYEKCPAN